MAEVFAGFALGSDGFQKPVAIKRLLPELAGDEGFVARLVAEAKLLVRMQHGNLVSVLDLVREHQDVFLVMEYVDGPSLRQLLHLRRAAGDGPLPLGVATYVLAAAATGLEFAHARPGGAIIHADVSPSNLLLTTSGEVKVADFGIARGEGVAQAVEGKWAYMAPEQARGEPLDVRADLFALGVVLYELVTGVHPLGRKVTSEERSEPRAVVPARVRRPDIPAALDAIIQRAMAPDPRARFGRAQELADALGELRFRCGWRDGAAELAAAIARVRPGAGGPAPVTHVTDRPLTIISRSLLGGSGAQGLVDRETVLERPLGRPRSPRPPRRLAAIGLAAAVLLAAIAVVTIPLVDPPPAIAVVEARPPPPRPAEPVAAPVAAPAPVPVPVVVPAAPAPPPVARKLEKETRRRPPLRAREERGPDAILRIHADPWAFVDIGDHHVETPAELELPAGRYKVRLHNPDTGARVTRTVTLQAGKVETLRVLMEE